MPAAAAPPPVVTDLTADTSSSDESDSDNSSGHHSSSRKKRKGGGGSGFGGDSGGDSGGSSSSFVFVLVKVDCPDQGATLPNISVLGSYSTSGLAEDAKADYLEEGNWEACGDGYHQGYEESAIEIHQTILDD